MSTHLSSAPNATQTLGDIAVQLPGATAVFRRLKLDFCCGGQLPLAQAVAAAGLDLDAVLAELSDLAQLQQPTDLPSTIEPSALIDHIIARYHNVHRGQLPELIRMAHRVEAVHRANPAVPAGLGDFLERMEQELTTHMHKEESILFPMLKLGGNPFVVHPIGMMRNEHVDHGVALEQLSALTNNATPPQGACNTWRALYGGIAQLSDDLMHHIHLENNLLFPHFETGASATLPAVAAVPAAAAATSAGSCGGSTGCSCS